MIYHFLFFSSLVSTLFGSNAPSWGMQGPCACKD